MSTVKTEYMFAKARAVAKRTGAAVAEGLDSGSHAAAPPTARPLAPVTFDGERRVMCVVFKYVGIWFSKDCTYEDHFAKALERARGAMFACDGRAMRLDRACPIALRCMMLRVYVYPLLTYCCEALPLPVDYIRKANGLVYQYACRATGVKGKPEGAALRRDCGLPDLEQVIARARACYMMVVRARGENHLTRVALRAIETDKRGVLHRLWMRPALGLLQEAMVDADSGLGGTRAGRARLGQVIKEHLEERPPPARGLRAHATFPWFVEGLIESTGYDISVARHGDVVRSRMREEGQWAAQYHAALPKAHLGALTSLRFGTAPLARNVEHDIPIGRRLCAHCIGLGRGGRAAVEDEAHVCFDCPLYCDIRATLVAELSGTKAPRLADGVESGAARALGGLLNPCCFASARAVARFAHDMLARRRESSCFYVASGVYEDARLTDARVMLARADLGRWLGMDIPAPCRVSLHASCLLRSNSPMVLGRARKGGVLGVSVFDPFVLDRDLREWEPARKLGGRRAAPPRPVCVDSQPLYSSLGDGMGAWRVAMEGCDLGESRFDPFELDQLERDGCPDDDC